MAKIAVNPRLLRDYVIEVGTNSYEAATASVTFTPTVPQQTWTGGDDQTYSESGPATWAVTIGRMQDWGTADSLARTLHLNEGQQVAAVFRPKRGIGPRFMSTITIAPGAIGGANGAWPVGDVTMGCTHPELLESSGAATGADAGEPGEFTPAYSDIPASFAEITGITADPATAWTEGQYVVLLDKSRAHWDGTAWQTGAAPAA